MGEAEYLGEVLLNFFLKRFTEIHKKIHKTISCTKVWQSSSKSASKLHSTFYIKTAIERMKSGSNQLKLQLSGAKPNLKDKIEA